MKKDVWVNPAPAVDSLSFPTPATETEPEGAETAIVCGFLKESGVKGDVPWTLWRVHLRLAGTEIWANTFDPNIGAIYELLTIPSRVYVVLSDGKPYDGKPTYNLTYLAEAL